MEIKEKSYFKDEQKDKNYFKNWVKELEINNQRVYEKLEVGTSIGKTQVYGLNTNEESLERLVIFPGAKTTSIIWDPMTTHIKQ